MPPDKNLGPTHRLLECTTKMSRAHTLLIGVSGQVTERWGETWRARQEEVRRSIQLSYGRVPPSLASLRYGSTGGRA